MTDGATTDLVALGEAALVSGDWDGARQAFEAVAASRATAEAWDGLGRAVWWLGDVDRAIEYRERAYAAFRKRGEAAHAATVALWLAREYLEAVGNEPASNGWVARAEGLIRDREEGPEHGWLELTRGSRAAAPVAMHRHAEAALRISRRLAAVDVEASALALVGRALLLDGEVEPGVAALDEAMTAITSGEVSDPLVFGDVCCVVTLACEESGELERLMRWNEVVETYLSRHLHGPLLSFCGTCGAEFFQAKGDMEMAERCLVDALNALQGTGHRSRCIHPAAKLAEIRVFQGRIEEAERLLAGLEDLPESLHGSVAVHRARKEYAVAAALLLRRLNRMAETVAAVPLLATLAAVQLEQGDLDGAGATVKRLDAIAARTGHPRVAATAALAGGRVALAATPRCVRSWRDPSKASCAWRCRPMPRALGSNWPARFATRPRRSPPERPRSLWRPSSAWVRCGSQTRRPLWCANSAALPAPDRRASGSCLRGRRRSFASWGKASRTRRSPHACSSARRRPGTT